MGKGLAVSLVLGLGLGFGCGDDDDVLDVDAAAGDIDASAGCPATYGPTAVSMTFEIATGDVGFDLNGDAEIDNAIGSSDGVRDLINTSFTDSLNSGSLRTLAELRDFGGLEADDSDLTLAFYGGVDSDGQDATADDFDGDEDYYYQHDWVLSLLTCEPRAAVAATYTGGVVNVAETDLTFFVDSLGGFLDIKKARIRSTIETDTAGYKTVAGTPAMVGGTLTICSLQNGEAPIGANALHALVQFFSIAPDIDVDGDGLEEVSTDSVGVIECKDGDGTIIPGEDCGCDERIQDGFSIAFLTDQVGAVILGPDPNP